MGKKHDIVKALRDTADGLLAHSTLIQARMDRLVVSRKRKLAFHEQVKEKQARRNERR